MRGGLPYRPSRSPTSYQLALRHSFSLRPAQPASVATRQMAMVRMPGSLRAVVLRFDEHALYARVGLLDAAVELVHDLVRPGARHVAGDVHADVGEDVFRPHVHVEHLVHAPDLPGALGEAPGPLHHLAVRATADHDGIG